MISKSFLVLGICVAYVGYITYHIPVPEDIQQPWKLRISLTKNAIMFNFFNILDKFGVAKDYEAQRWWGYRTAGVEGVDISEAVLDGVPVHVFVPAGVKNNGKGMVYFHGGGWLLGSSTSESSIIGYFAKEGQMVVISVDYRLAPEHSKNDGLDDCVKVTKYVIQNAKEFKVDANRVAVGGASAGGNYAAAVSLRLRDENFAPLPKLQLLLVPALQAIDLQLPSYQQNRDGPHLSATRMNWFFSYVLAKDKRLMPYLHANTHVTADVRVSLARGALSHNLLPSHNKHEPYLEPNFNDGRDEIWQQIKEDVMDPYGYPLMAEDLSNLPEAYIFTAQYDVLRDEGYLYAHHMREAGVEVTHHNCVFGWHSMGLFLDMKDVREEYDQIIQFMEDRL